MNKHKLNYLKFLTKGEIEDKVLEQSFNHKFEDGKFIFNIKARFTNPQDWVAIYRRIK